MYTITRKEWNEIKRRHPDYTGKAIMRHEHDGKVCEAGEAVCFASLLPDFPKIGIMGPALVFEHIHFEIID